MGQHSAGERDVLVLETFTLGKFLDHYFRCAAFGQFLDHGAAMIQILVADGKKTQKAFAPAWKILRAGRLQTEALCRGSRKSPGLSLRYYHWRLGTPKAWNIKV